MQWWSRILVWSTTLNSNPFGDTTLFTQPFIPLPQYIPYYNTRMLIHTFLTDWTFVTLISPWSCFDISFIFWKNRNFQNLLLTNKTFLLLFKFDFEFRVHFNILYQYVYPANSTTWQFPFPPLFILLFNIAFDLF